MKLRTYLELYAGVEKYHGKLDGPIETMKFKVVHDKAGHLLAHNYAIGTLRKNGFMPAGFDGHGPARLDKFRHPNGYTAQIATSAGDDDEIMITVTAPRPMLEIMYGAFN